MENAGQKVTVKSARSTVSSALSALLTAQRLQRDTTRNANSAQQQQLQSLTAQQQNETRIAQQEQTRQLQAYEQLRARLDQTIRWQKPLEDVVAALYADALRDLPAPQSSITTDVECDLAALLAQIHPIGENLQKAALQVAQCLLTLEKSNEVIQFLESWRHLVAYPIGKEAIQLQCEGYLQLARRAIAQEDWPGARQSISKILAIVPTHPRAAELLRETYLIPARAARANQNWQGIRTCLEPWWQTHPSDSEATQLLVESYYRPGFEALQRKHWAQARAAFQACLQFLTPPNLYARGKIYEPISLGTSPGSGHTHTDTPLTWERVQARIRETHLRPALMALEQREWKKVRDELHPWRQNHSDDFQTDTTLFESYYRPALELLEAGEWRQARNAFRACLQYSHAGNKAQDGIRETYFRPAQRALKQGLFADARSLVNEYLQESSRDRKAFELLARINAAERWNRLKIGTFLVVALLALIFLCLVGVWVTKWFNDAGQSRQAWLAHQNQDWGTACVAFQAVYKTQYQLETTRVGLLDSCYHALEASIKQEAWAEGAQWVQVVEEYNYAYKDILKLIRDLPPLQAEVNNRYTTLWSNGKPKLQQTFMVTSVPVNFLRFSPNEKYIAAISTASKESPAHVIVGDLTSNTVHHIPVEATTLTFDPAGNEIALGLQNGVSFLNAVTLEITPFLEGAPVTALAFSEQGAYLAVAQNNQNLSVVARQDKTIAWNAPGAVGVSGLTFVDDRRLAIAYQNGQAEIREIDGTVLKVFLHRKQVLWWQDPIAVQSIAASRDMDLLATGDAEGALWLWNLKDGNLVQKLTPGIGPIQRLKFSPDGALLLIASQSQAQLVRVKDGVRVQQLTNWPDVPTGVDFSPLGNYILIGLQNKKMNIYSVSP